MKKILFVLAVVAALFAVTACGTAMHDGTEMAIASIKITGLPASMEGKVLEFMGFWGGGTAATGDALVTVTGGEAIITFTPPAIESAPAPELKLKPTDATGGWDWAIGASLRLGGADVPNAPLANTWTGPVVEKNIVGVANADNTVTWTIE